MKNKKNDNLTSTEYNKFIADMLDNVFKIERSKNHDYIDYYIQLYKSYKNHIKEYDNELYNQIEKEIDNVYNKILEYIKMVLLGRYGSIHQSMNNWWFSKNGKQKYANIYKTSLTDVYFRIRVKHNNELFTHTDMRYVPIEKRGELHNYRYSVSGLPCFYIGRSFLTCWEEMRRPIMETVFISAVKFMKEMNLLDLRLYRNIENELDFKNYLYLFPLIMACSVRVQRKNEDDFFKAEYIVPQIFMQIISYKKDYDGIIFTSTQMDKKNPYNNISLYDNIAIPIKYGFSNNNKIKDEYKEYFMISNPLDVGYEQLLESFNSVKGDYRKSLFGMLEEKLINSLTE